ncbi:MAG: flagellar basal body L-ring protein FlgH [Kangiellaceae bacterium]|jgi:flagellar L-ring protein precursor FlgH|nr:flagellar basal body L-ring protein FlgH [Kangiellaceae bacterium]
MNKLKAKVSTVLLAVSLTGCVSFIPPSPDDPNFAPVVPQKTKFQKVSAGSLFSENNQMLLYTDNKANQVGDIITITLTEVTTANKLANTITRKQSDITLPNPILAGRNLAFNSGQQSFETNAELGNEFRGESQSLQNNSLNGTITVTVQSVLPNGNLIVRGEKWITLNQGDEFIRLSGILRPQDVSSDNTVPSSRVANARIQYSGRGQVADSNTQGWLARFFNSVWWPF